MDYGGVSLMHRVAALLRAGVETPSQPGIRSILTQAATAYAKRPVAATETVPTGFDPRAAVLFEAVVEAAFLVANADGEFDAEERRTFEAVVTQACVNELTPKELHELVTQLCQQLEQDGAHKRVQAICRAVTKQAHKVEVLRIAALMGHISGGVDDAERDVLRQLAKGLGLGDDGLEEALAQARQALGAP